MHFLKRLSGILVFFLCIFGFFFSIWFFFAERAYNDVFDDEFFVFIMTFTASVTGMFYVLATGFGGSRKRVSELEKVEMENRLLAKQLEQKRLKEELYSDQQFVVEEQEFE